MVIFCGTPYLYGDILWDTLPVWRHLPIRMWACMQCRTYMTNRYCEIWSLISVTICRKNCLFFPLLFTFQMSQSLPNGQPISKSVTDFLTGFSNNVPSSLSHMISVEQYLTYKGLGKAIFFLLLQYISTLHNFGIP